MNLSTQTIQQHAVAAYEWGNRNPCDDAAAYVAAVVEHVKANMPAVPPVDTTWRLYTVAELRDVPLGTLFEHKKHGLGYVSERDGIRFMHFGRRHAPSCFKHDGQEPWDVEMRQVEGTLEDHNNDFSTS